MRLLPMVECLRSLQQQGVTEVTHAGHPSSIEDAIAEWLPYEHQAPDCYMRDGAIRRVGQKGPWFESSAWAEPEAVDISLLEGLDAQGPTPPETRGWNVDRVIALIESAAIPGLITDLSDVRDYSPRVGLPLNWEGGVALRVFREDGRTTTEVSWSSTPGSIRAAEAQRRADLISAVCKLAAHIEAGL